MISWRVPALLVAVGAPTVAVSVALSYVVWPPLGAVLGVVLLVTLADWLVAAPAGEVRLRRTGPVQVRMGETVTVTRLR